MMTTMTIITAMTITTTIMRMTMTTKEQDAMLRKAVRARNLTDPLGAMGFRAPGQRFRREARIRRIAFAATALGFAGILAAVIGSAPAPASQTVSVAAAAPVARTSQTTRVISGSAQIAQRQPTHTRTRGS